MGKIFHWFYCLPIADAVMVIFLGSAVFFLLRAKFRDMIWWKGAVGLLFFAWIAVILYGTLGQRAEGGSLSQPILTPFASYHGAFYGGQKELYRANFMNTVLFYPAGLLGGELLPGRWHWIAKALPVTLLLILVSTGIEYSQSCFGLGLAEVDDVIHNGLGAFLGAMAVSAAANLHKK